MSCKQIFQRLVKVLRPLDSSPTNFDFNFYTNDIYQCCFHRLKVTILHGSIVK